MKTFLVVMISILTYLGGLNLQSLEIEVLALTMHHLVSLHEAETLMKFLLRTIIEYHQIELGIDKQLFLLNYNKFGMLVTPTLVTSL